MFFVYHVDVGNIPPEKAQEYLEEVKQGIARNKEKDVFVPSRNGDSYVQSFSETEGLTVNINLDPSKVTVDQAAEFVRGIRKELE